jgi:TPR repeat protein
MYAQGIGGDRDMRQAYFWLLCAQLRGWQQATTALNAVGRLLDGEEKRLLAEKAEHKRLELDVQQRRIFVEDPDQEGKLASADRN